MIAAVLVELPPVDNASPYTRALLDACTGALQHRARCELAQDQPPEVAGTAIAIVTWNGNEHVAVRIEVGVVGGGERWRGQTLSFSPSDPEVERWWAVGLGIATLVGDAAPQDTPEKPTGDGPVPRTSASLPAGTGGAGGSTGGWGEVQAATTPSTSHVAWRRARSWFDAGLSVGRGVAGVTPSLGGELRMSLALPGDRWFFVGSASYRAQGLDVNRILVERFGAALGIGLVGPSLGANVRLELRAQTTLGWTRASGIDPVTGATGGIERWLVGLEQGVDVVWLGSERFGLSAGAALTEAAARTVITDHGTEVATIPVVDFIAGAGLRWGFR